MKIGLIGFEFFSANKGCEALVYSFISLIEEYLDEKDVIYNFSGSELGIVPDYFRDITFVNIPNKLKDFNCKYLRHLSKCDIIFDVTMGDSFSDIYSYRYYCGLIRHKRIAQALCKKYVLLPQTYGPFKNTDSEIKAKGVFDRALMIFCRDEVSQKLLAEKFNIHKAVLVSDMAFVLPYNKTQYSFSGKKKVGINVSGLLYKGGFTSANQFDLKVDYKKLICDLICDLGKDFEIHLIPHVIDLDDSSYDDDYKICNELNRKYPNTILAPAFNSPIEAKSYISNMDFFIGSRMHSTIAAFSSGVVTIPISYSRKFEGLFGSLNYPYVVNAREETTETAYELVLKYIDKKEELSKVQSESMKTVNEKNTAFKESLATLFSEE